MFRRLVYSLSLVLLVACKKSNDNVTIHCDNLVNETLPAGDGAQVFIANAFTPNGDGLNDVFKVHTTQIASMNVKVFDSNSNLVFESSSLTPAWNYIPSSASNAKFFFRVEAVSNSNFRIGRCGEVNALLCHPRNAGPGSFSFEDQLTPFGFTGVTGEALAPCN